MAQINETAIKTPGVYTTEIPSFPPSVAQVATAVPAFIGYTEKAEDGDGNDLTNIPTKIYSIKEYEQYFGTAENEKKIKVDVKIMTTGNPALSALASISNISPHNMFYSLRSYFDNGGGPCYIISVGKTTGTVKDADLKKGLENLEAFDEPTLILFPEGQSLDEAKYYSLIDKAIKQCALLQDRFSFVDIHTPKNTTDTTISNFRAKFVTSTDLNYAAAYYPNLKTTYDYQYDDSDVSVVIIKDGGAPAAPVKLDKVDSAVYFACKNAILKLSPTLPPSPAVAGIYAKTDAQRGVWKAPANVSVSGIYDLTDIVTDQKQEDMNIDTGSGKSVNAIRQFTGKGFLVWGARTLDGNSNEWRYVSVRRFFIMVEESCKKATFPFVFEPNDANTWVKVRAMIENYLTILWRQGALAGAKPEHAFYVKCGLGQTMTAQDILEGRLIVEIGLAAVRPAEFIILRFTHKMQES
jgi:Bacteriophage tail sheath protein